ncbi:MAG: hypothetical protein H6748_01860 [Spirochaetaceae bacterium]|nr:hypothetical protein [Spirochaetaceae bacterium]
MSATTPDRVVLLPNLGAEEGSDWDALRRVPSVRTAARLWSLLFSRQTLRYVPGDRAGRCEARDDAGWPEALGPSPEAAVWPWLEPASGSGAIVWLPTPTVAELARRELDLALLGPSPVCVRHVHDKAFAVEAARAADALPRALSPLLEVLEPEALADAPRAVTQIERRVSNWPDWTGGRFTLKPRQGSSGRGRAGGVAPFRDDAARDRLIRALPGLAARGGALLEPWLERTRDLSVCLRIPEPGEADPRPVMLGSLEMLASPSGVYRGHVGEVDSRGRVFSGDADDETLRAEGAVVAGLARAAGLHGVCGVDAFRYVAGGHTHRRGVVEVNARATMGLVAVGLVRRALPQVREALALLPGARRGFALVVTTPSDDPARDSDAIARGLAAQVDGIALDLGDGGEATAPRAWLLFGREREVLREAVRTRLGL